MPGRALLAELKADPGQVGLETLLQEIDKLAAVRALGLPPGLFSDASVGSEPPCAALELGIPIGGCRSSGLSMCGADWAWGGCPSRRCSWASVDSRFDGLD